ncbi:hypothetical protein [Bacillus cereus]|uniref:hypothetical protein n=1 Tax=Bacillus cereus TaxID=1396 RepID=UPI000BFA1785|nr:hypothetical protein [Bacillus cereus]PET96221.1 hypothetical protein CN534_23805 [Bacillus cereus]PEZ54710.1 hypothetical protein CN370_27525 [Bacillus cereus]PFB62383.1 hypothetical protein CN292_27010 [Bacillus cereus]HDR8152409.1 hypothetical protein [Bacillus cereus]
MKDFLTVIIGPLTGSFLAGMVAFIIMRRNQSYDVLKEKRKERNNFLKATYVYNHVVEDIKKSLNGIDAIAITDLVYFQKNQMFTIYYEVIKKGLNQLEKIPDDYIIHESYQYFLETKALISMFEADYGKFLSRYQGDCIDSFLLTMNFENKISELEELQTKIMKIKNDLVI